MQRQGRELYYSPPHPDRLWGPPTLLSNGYPWPSPQEIKQQGREDDNLPLAGVEIKNAWSCISTPHTSSWRGA